MKQLLDIGFVEAGKWKLGKNKSGIDFNLKRFEEETQILYAFLSEKQVLYIGKSDNTLKNRLQGYKNASPSQTTNQRVQNYLKSMLTEGTEISIYVLADTFEYNHKGVRIRLSSGLEDNLIESIRPLLNYRSNGRVRVKEILTEHLDSQRTVFEMNMEIPIGATRGPYIIKSNGAQNGRINFPKKQIDYNLLPPFNTEVTVFIGHGSSEFFIANLIDSNNGKGNPNARINSKILASWYADESLELQDTFNLEIINSTTFRIYK